MSPGTGPYVACFNTPLHHLSHPTLQGKYRSGTSAHLAQLHSNCFSARQQSLSDSPPPAPAPAVKFHSHIDIYIIQHKSTCRIGQPCLPLLEPVSFHSFCIVLLLFLLLCFHILYSTFLLTVNCLPSAPQWPIYRTSHSVSTSNNSESLGGASMSSSLMLGC